MNYLEQAKKGEEEKANSGRMKGRLAAQEPVQDEGTYDDNFIVGPISEASLPAEPPATPAEPEPTEAPKPIATGAPKKAKKHGKSNKKNTEEEADPNKDKYSIYLPKKLSLALRMVYVITGKKFSHIAETALTDMLFNRYQCNNPACTVRFTMSETEDKPTVCPVCGGKKFEPLRLDIME